MKHYIKGFAIQGLLALVGLVLITVAAFYLSTNKGKEFVGDTTNGVCTNSATNYPLCNIGLPITASSTEPTPYIRNITPAFASIGDQVDIVGLNFAGFEGDLYAIIENVATGVKGVVYNDPGSTDSLIRFTLKDTYCTRDNSYSGLPCEEYLYITPGEYNIYVAPWGKMSNKVKFVVNTPQGYDPANRIEKNEWGISFVKGSMWEVTSNTDLQMILEQQTGEWKGDKITISNFTGTSVTDVDTKFGTVSYYWSDAQKKWLTAGSADRGDFQDIEATTNRYIQGEIPIFMGTHRWRTYIVPLSHTQFLKFNITGSGNVIPLDNLMQSIEITG